MCIDNKKMTQLNHDILMCFTTSILLVNYVLDNDVKNSVTLIIPVVYTQRKPAMSMLIYKCTGFVPANMRVRVHAGTAMSSLIKVLLHVFSK